MVTNIVWWAAILLEAAILLRGYLTGLLRKYPLFYSYLFCVFAKELIGLWSYYFAPTLYEPLYWPSELITVLASYAVVVEVFRCGLRDYPGIAKVAQNLLLIVLSVALVVATAKLAQGRNASLSGAVAELGRQFRYIEAAILVSMLFVLTRYRIRLGPNLLGLVTGYAFWLAVNIVTLALWFLPGNEGSLALRTLLPVSYVVSLTFWCVALWSLKPELIQLKDDGIEHDYTAIAQRIKLALRLHPRVRRTPE